MDFRQLRQFVTVAETLHFGRAAERLGMTQPPLSQSIMALERELGAPLFTRSNRNVALTAFGRQWLDQVRPLVDGFAALPEAARRLREGRAGQLSLSFVSTADYSVLPALVRNYAAAYPDVEIVLTEATSDVQIEALTESRVHAGIVITASAPLPDALAYRPLLREPLVAAVPEGWAGEGRLPTRDGRLAGDRWMDEPLIIFPRRVAPAFHDLVLDYFLAKGRRANIQQEAIQMQTIISLVSAGMGTALVPASLRNLARRGVVYLDLPEKGPVLETGIAWRKADDSATLAAFLGIALQA